MVGYPRERFTITLHSCVVIGGIAPPLQPGGKTPGTFSFAR